QRLRANPRPPPVPPLLRPADGAAQAEGRGPLRVHPPGEEEPELPALHPGLAALRTGGDGAAGGRRGGRAAPRGGGPLRPRASLMAGGARAFVLAAGLGTRLRPLTDTWPKPAVPFLGAPLLRRTFAVLARAGVERVAVNTHHLPDVMERVAREEGARRGLSVSTVHEPVIQGTGGGLRGLQRA